MGDNYRPHPSHQVPADLSHFWVITVLSNSPRYRRRFELLHPFVAMLNGAGVNHVVVELAFGQRDWMVTDPRNPNHLQLRSYEELFHKENLINLGIQHARTLDPQIDKVAWIDADLRPTRAPRQWFEETWHELQHYKFVQMYSEFYDLDYNHNMLGGGADSFMGAYFKYDMTGPQPSQACLEDPRWCLTSHPHHHHHHKKHRRHHPHHPHSGNLMLHSGSGDSIWFGPPGGAWAADVTALNDIGMIPDFCILGSGDWHLACALTHSMNPKDPEFINDKYTEALLERQERCDRWIRQDVGVVKGALLHDNHGPKISRNYRGRKQILTRNHFNPATDIKYDHQGVLQLETYNPRQVRLRDEVRQYFKLRNDDVPEYRKT